jgi:hypothetical protein
MGHAASPGECCHRPLKRKWERKWCRLKENGVASFLLEENGVASFLLASCHAAGETVPVPDAGSHAFAEG